MAKQQPGGPGNPRGPVVPTYATMAWVENEIKRAKMQILTRKRGPKKWPRKGGGGGGTPFTCIIDGTIPAATWDDANKELEPGTQEAWLLEWDATEAAYELDKIVVVEWVDTTSVSIAAGQARIGKGVLADSRYQLFSISCEEVPFTV